MLQIIWMQLGESVRTSAGFFWKAAWAFVIGYAISAMIQVFVPKARLTPRMGKANLTGLGFASLFGMISSSCSFAALSTSRALMQKGAHFICTVAFMFASTNLVVELGVLILIFLGWQFLIAELIGGLLLIAISSLIIKLTYPTQWINAAHEKVAADHDHDEDDFNWKKRIKSFDSWCHVGNQFVMEWKMVWQEILIGFTIAGFMAVLVPKHVWETLFLAEMAKDNPGSFLIALQNAAVAPFVAGITFIGSMGNIPLATVLNSGGVLFAGIMGFIYSDLMVPPLVKVNARYYGWRVALYIAGVMYVSIVITSLILHYVFYFAGMTQQNSQQVNQVTRFALDYTFFLNLAAILLAVGLYIMHRRHHKKMMQKSHSQDAHDQHDHGHENEDEHHDHKQNKWDVQAIVTWLFMVILVLGMIAWGTTGQGA